MKTLSRVSGLLLLLIVLLALAACSSSSGSSDSPPSSNSSSDAPVDISTSSPSSTVVANEDPVEVFASDFSGLSMDVSQQASGPVSFEASLFPGETVLYDFSSLGFVENVVEADHDLVSIQVEDNMLSVKAFRDASSGLFDVEFTVSICVASSSDCQDVVFDVSGVVSEFPASPDDAVPVVAVSQELLLPVAGVEGSFTVDGEFIVISKPGTDLERLASETGSVLVGGFPEVNVWQFRTAAGYTFDDALVLFGGRDDVVEVVPHVVAAVDSNAVDSVSPGDWGGSGLDLPDDDSTFWHFSRFGFQQAWGVIRSAPDVKVGVIDYGIFPVHEDLNVPVVAKSCSSDDVSCVEPWRTLDHGTHVAGLACADDNGVGGVGASWGCDVLAVDISDAPDPFNASVHKVPHATVSALIILSAMLKVVDLGADVVNMSIGVPLIASDYGVYTGFEGQDTLSKAVCGQDSPEMKTVADNVSTILKPAIYYGARTRAAQGRSDVLWVAAAGNRCMDAHSSSPANLRSFANVISVASLDSNKELSAFSNWGYGVSIAAPGGFLLDDVDADTSLEDVPSVWSSSVDCSSDSCVSSYRFDAGTSMAAPIISGLLALMRQESPDLLAEYVEECLVEDTVSVQYRNQNGSWVPFEYPELDRMRIPVVNPHAAVVCAQRFSSVPGWDFIDASTSSDQFVSSYYAVDGHLFHIKFPVFEDETLSNAVRTWVEDYVADVMYSLANNYEDGFFDEWHHSIHFLTLRPDYVSDVLSSFTLTGFVTYGGVGWDPNQPVLFDANGQEIDLLGEYIDGEGYYSIWDSAIYKFYNHPTLDSPFFDDVDGDRLEYGIAPDGSLAVHAPPDSLGGSAYGSPTIVIDWHDATPYGVSAGDMIDEGSALSLVIDGSANALSPQELEEMFGPSSFGVPYSGDF